MAGQEHEPGGLAPESGLLVTASHQLSLRSECPPISDITQYVLEDKSHLSTLFPKPQAQCLAQYVLTDDLMNKRLGKEGNQRKDVLSEPKLSKLELVMHAFLCCDPRHRTAPKTDP